MQHHIIETAEELIEVCGRLKAAGSFAMDTEFVRERTFFIQLGIVQVAAADFEVVIDPLAMDNLDPLYEVIADPSVEVVVHAGEQDFSALYERGGGVVPSNVFDSQVAAALVGYGDQISYAKLVARVTGVQLPKLETLTDWTARPLTKAQIEYSLEDVRYLAAIRAHLAERLEALGRAGWEREEGSRLESEATYRSPDPDEYYRRLKTGGLSRESLGVLRTVASWREETARSRDLPRGWVLRDQSILEIARRRPTSPKGLKQIRSLKPSQIGKDGDVIVEAVKAGVANPIEPLRTEGGRLKVPPEIDSISRLLEAWLYARAAEEEIAPSMLATRADLKSLVVGHYHSQIPALPVLEGWRHTLVGQDLLDILDGKKTLRIQDGKKILSTPSE